MPHIDVTLAGEEAPNHIPVGERVLVCVAGTPSPQCLVAKNPDGQYEILWPLETDTADEPNVELELETTPPVGQIVLYAIFGPSGLTANEALSSVMMVDSGSLLPSGWHSARRSLHVIARP